jgi:hypothetical protein
VITCSATLAVRDHVVDHVVDLLTAHRGRIGTRQGRRVLDPLGQAVLVSRWFIDATRVTPLARDHRISLSTAYRYLHEGIDVLAATAPELHQVLRVVTAVGVPHLILDGTLIPTARLAARTERGNDVWYSGKHRRHGGNVQFLTTPDGWPLWVSPVTEGSCHDLTAARAHATSALNAARIPVLADKAYWAAGATIHAPLRNTWAAKAHPLHLDNQQRNLLITALRRRGERAIALLKMRYRALHKVSLCPWRITGIIAAALALTHHEHHRCY